MFDFIEGEIIEISPAHMVIKTGGIGYFVHISVNTFAQLEHEKNTRLYVHQIVRDDAHLLYGFSHINERQVFLLLLSVNGVGANTARMILSSLNADEVTQAISTNNVNAFKSIKGIGAKSAQRIIIELQDKIDKNTALLEIVQPKGNRTREEALDALVMLGFVKKNAEKVVNNIAKETPDIKLEELIRAALKQL